MRAALLMATPCIKLLGGEVDVRTWDWCVLLKRTKAESEAQRGEPKGALESESRNAIV